MNERIRQDLESIGPDLTNITRLFGLPDVPWDGSGPFSYDLREEEGRFVCVFRRGERTAERAVDLPAGTGDPRVDALHRRRACGQHLHRAMIFGKKSLRIADLPAAALFLPFQKSHL